MVLPLTASQNMPPQQTAPAQQAAGPSLTPEEAGKVIRGNYVNEFFGLEVKPIPDWELLGRGQMNVSEAFGREAMGLRLGEHNKSRVFGMHDGRGANTFLSIVAIPPDAKDINTRDQKLIEYAKRDLPNPKITSETVLLSDGPHVFTGFRVQYAIQGQTVFQSLQTTVWKDHVLGFTTTSDSPQALSATLASLKKAITWK